MHTRLTPLCLLLLCACGKTSPADADDPVDAGSDVTVADASTDPDAASTDAAIPPESDAAPPEVDAALPDPSDPVFAKDHLIEVAIEIDEADWEALRFQSRGDLDRAGEDCLGEPFPSPYTWFHADVTVDGARYEDVGVRKKGFFGSVSSNRPSLKIRFDKYEEQTHESLTRLTLNNSRQDPSLMKTCLAYDMFERAGVPTPRCNFAHLTVNGFDFGVFVHVEALKKPFIRRHFSDDSGDLYEGTLSDFREGWNGTIEQKTDGNNRAPIDALIAAAQAPDDELLGALDAAMDLDAFFTFWAIEVVVAHWDGYAGNTNNFWFYDDPERGVVFIPWGPDGTFQRPRLLFEGLIAPPSVLATGIITRRLYLHAEGRERYLERIQEVLAEIWDAARMREQIATWTALVEPALAEWQREPRASAETVLRDWIEAQAGRVLGDIINGPAIWAVPLREGFCQVPVGELSGTFDTTWGTWPADDAFSTGSGTMQATVGEEAFEPVRVGAAAGIGDRGEGMLLMPAFLPDETLVFVYVGVKPEDVQTGTLRTGDFQCSLNELRGGRRVSPIASCPEGELVFDEASREPGAPVRGSYRFTLFGSEI